MTIDELKDKQIKYLSQLPEIQKDLKELEKSRKKFVKTFSIEKLSELPLEVYVCGTQKPKNFCNWLERGLRKLGSIVGSTSFKFGVYYGVVKGDNEQKYRFAEKWGSTHQEAYQNVIATIVSLLRDGTNDNISRIKDNPLSPMLKGKILNIYFPEKFLSVFSETHINHYLSDFGVPLLKNYHVVEKRAMLLDIKNENEVMSKWTNYEFAFFLYRQLERPDKKNVPKELEGHIPIDFPPLPNVKAVFIEKTLDELPNKSSSKASKEKSGYIDFEKKNKRNARRGERGEHIVLKKEQEVLEKAGRSDLADKVEQISEKDTYAGYDIVSFSTDGTLKRIEVKSTTGKPNSVTFYLSANELRKSKELDNYYIYLVFEVDTLHPKILSFKSPFQKADDRIQMEPTAYAVRMKLKD